MSYRTSSPRKPNVSIDCRTEYTPKARQGKMICYIYVYWWSSWKDINKNTEPVKLKLYSLQIYKYIQSWLQHQHFFEIRRNCLHVLHICRLFWSVRWITVSTANPQKTLLSLLCSRDLSYKFPYLVATFIFIYQNIYFCFPFKFTFTFAFLKAWLEQLTV